MSVDPVTPINIQHLEKLLSEATPGPWRWGWQNRDAENPNETYLVRSDSPSHFDPVALTRREKQGWIDAALIAAAVNSLPALLELYRAASEVRDQLEGETGFGLSFHKTFDYLTEALDALSEGEET